MKTLNPPHDLAPPGSVLLSATTSDHPYHAPKDQAASSGHSGGTAPGASHRRQEIGGVSTAPSLRRQRRNGATLCSMPSSVLAESGSLLAVAVERWHVEPRVMVAIHGSWRGASPGTRPHQWLWRPPLHPGRAWIASHFLARRGNLLTKTTPQRPFEVWRNAHDGSWGSPGPWRNPCPRPCEHVSLSVLTMRCAIPNTTETNSQRSLTEDRMKTDAAHCGRLRATTPRFRLVSLSINGNGHCQGGSLQDGLMRSIFGGEDPRNLAWWSSKHAVQWKNKQQTKTPRRPARSAQTIVLLEIGSA